MKKGEFIFRFLSNELVIVMFGEEMGVFERTDPYGDAIYLPSSWYYEAIETYNKRILN